MAAQVNKETVKAPGSLVISAYDLLRNIFPLIFIPMQVRDSAGHYL